MAKPASLPAPTGIGAVPLSAKLEKSLLDYAAAATAAGVGMLALAGSAEAKIVYTRANQQIVPNHRFPLDLNHDKKVDFTLVDTHGSFFGTMSTHIWGFLTVYPNRSANAIWGYQVGDNGFLRYASALSAGVKLGPMKGFSPGQKIMADSIFSTAAMRPNSTNCSGPWKGTTNRYLGFQFKIKNETHYGWARLSVSCSSETVTGTLTGYAYETIPNKPIVTGKTKGPDDATERTSLGYLARGAAAHPVQPGR